MTTWYTLCSSFTACPDVTEEKEVLDHIAREPAFSNLFGDDSTLSVTSVNDRVKVELEFGNHIGYSSVSALDDAWTELVKKYADFSLGPVNATSGGDDFTEAGLVCWMIGPESQVLTAKVASVTSDIQTLVDKRKWLQELLSKATDQVITL